MRGGAVCHRRSISVGVRPEARLTKSLSARSRFKASATRARVGSMVRVCNPEEERAGSGAQRGCPAAAGKVLSLEGGSKHSEIHGETVSDRLKPGLHTRCPSFARQIGGLVSNVNHASVGPNASIRSTRTRMLIYLASNRAANPFCQSAPNSSTLWPVRCFQKSSP